jgi:hypothetical protein
MSLTGDARRDHQLVKGNNKRPHGAVRIHSMKAGEGDRTLDIQLGEPGQ